MNFFVRMLVLVAILITVSSAQPVSARQYDKARVLIDELLGPAFVDFERCTRTISENNSDSQDTYDKEKKEKLESELENIKHYIQEIEQLKLCDEYGRKYISASNKVALMQYGLLTWRGTFLEGENSNRNCVDIIDDLQTGIDTLVSLLINEDNFSELRDCTIRINNNSTSFKVIRNNLKLYKRPNIDSEIICLIPKDETVFDNINKIGEWYEVIYFPVRDGLDGCENEGQAIKGWVDYYGLLPE